MVLLILAKLNHFSIVFKEAKARAVCIGLGYYAGSLKLFLWSLEKEREKAPSE